MTNIFVILNEVKNPDGGSGLTMGFFGKPQNDRKRWDVSRRSARASQAPGGKAQGDKAGDEKTRTLKVLVGFYSATG